MQQGGATVQQGDGGLAEMFSQRRLASRQETQQIAAIANASATPDSNAVVGTDHARGLMNSYSTPGNESLVSTFKDPAAAPTQKKPSSLTTNTSASSTGFFASRTPTSISALKATNVTTNQPTIADSSAPAVTPTNTENRMFGGWDTGRKSVVPAKQACIRTGNIATTPSAPNTAHGNPLKTAPKVTPHFKAVHFAPHDEEFVFGAEEESKEEEVSVASPDLPMAASDNNIDTNMLQQDEQNYQDFEDVYTNFQRNLRESNDTAADLKDRILDVLEVVAYETAEMNLQYADQLDQCDEMDEMLNRCNMMIKKLEE
jgi:hypothetical protein